MNLDGILDMGFNLAVLVNEVKRPGDNIAVYQSFFKEVLDAPIMLCSDNKDSNGKEIYDGDIYFPKNDSNKYAVSFQNGTFMGSLPGEEGYPLAWDTDEDKTEIILYGTEWLTVIGNIYENPELLNK